MVCTKYIHYHHQVTYPEINGTMGINWPIHITNLRLPKEYKGQEVLTLPEQKIFDPQMQMQCYVFDRLWTVSLHSALSSIITIHFPLIIRRSIGLPSFVSPYPLSLLSSIVPCLIQWLVPYHLILVTALILYDTSLPKAVLLYTWTMSPRLSSLTCSESSASI